MRQPRSYLTLATLRLTFAEAQPPHKAEADRPAGADPLDPLGESALAYDLPLLVDAMIAPELLADGPAIILVEPQLGENIGTAARAMANFGLGDLRLVKPRDGWPNEAARRTASRADHVLDRIRVYDSVAEAVADLRYVAATTARHREMFKIVRGPGAAAEIMRGHMVAGSATGVMFGRERIGLVNEEISLADEIVTLPVDPRFASLNIAQAVLIIGYEWRRSGLAAEEDGLRFQMPDQGPPASKEQLGWLFDHLEGALDAVNFFRPIEKRTTVTTSLRAMLQRAQLSEQEVRTLRGVIAALENRPTRPHRGPDGTMTTSQIAAGQPAEPKEAGD